MLDWGDAGEYEILMSVAAMQTEIMALPAEEKVKLIDFIWETLSSESLKHREAAWPEESERRIDASEAGQMECRDASEVISTLRRALRK